MISLDIETTGLYPDKNDRIVAIGIIDDYGLTIFSAPLEEFKISLDVAELHILTSFSNFFYELPESEAFLTFNGVAFDIPFISTRAIEHGMTKFAEDILSMRDCDLARFTQGAVGRRMNKGEACSKLANLYTVRRTDGLWSARIYSNPQLLTVRDHLEMLAHNAADLADTMRFYDVIKDFPDFQEWRAKEAKSEVQA